MTLDLTADIIDIRDIISRIEEIELDLTGDEFPTDEEIALLEEHKTLTAIMEELKGNGGDEQWRGDWYPLQLIADIAFEDYARELCEEIGDIPAELPHYIVVDWSRTADNIRMDYTSVEIEGCTYWYR